MSPLLVLPVSVALALGVTQLLAAGMVAPLRRMTEVSGAMARGDYSGRVRTTATDEVGRLAAAFNRMAEDLATVDRERRDLIATVSHELRTPLTAMTALLENLADGVVPADADHLGAALDEAQRLGRLVDDLLQLSRLEAGVVELDRQDVALRDAGRGRRRAGRVGRPVRRRFDVRVPDDLVVAGRPGPAAPAASSTCSTTPVATRPPTTTVRVTAGGRRDRAGGSRSPTTGRGVAPADRERVFERFGTDGAGGTGSASPSSRWVAQLHGGTLRFLDPASGRGARLRLDVPPRPRPRHRPTRCRAPPGAHHDHATPPPAPAPPARPQPGLDTLFGRFWPERGLPARTAHRPRRGRGRASSPAIALSFTAVGHHVDAGRARLRHRGAARPRAAAASRGPSRAPGSPSCSCCR